MNVRISIVGGPYAGLGTYEGALDRAPVTTLVPEGIVSTRTADDAIRVREAIACTLVGSVRKLTMTAPGAGWEIQAELVDPTA